jgi:hypothetical protein
VQDTCPRDARNLTLWNVKNFQRCWNTKGVDQSRGGGRKSANGACCLPRRSSRT